MLWKKIWIMSQAPIGWFVYFRDGAVCDGDVECVGAKLVFISVFLLALTLFIVLVPFFFFVFWFLVFLFLSSLCFWFPW